VKTVSFRDDPKDRTSDVQLRIGESLDFGFASLPPRNDGTTHEHLVVPFRSSLIDGRNLVGTRNPTLPQQLLGSNGGTQIMANERFPDDPYRSNLGDDDVRRQARLDNELQPDPELAEGPASGAKVAMFAVAIAVVLGAIFYGLNNTTINQAGTSSTAQNSSQTSPPAAPPGMRDATPRTNTGPGMTTGAAPARPQSPPASAPTGQEIDRSANPPASK